MRVTVWLGSPPSPPTRGTARSNRRLVPLKAAPYATIHTWADLNTQFGPLAKYANAPGWDLYVVLARKERQCVDGSRGRGGGFPGARLRALTGASTVVLRLHLSGNNRRKQSLLVLFFIS